MNKPQKIKQIQQLATEYGIVFTNMPSENFHIQNGVNININEAMVAMLEKRREARLASGQPDSIYKTESLRLHIAESMNYPYMQFDPHYIFGSRDYDSVDANKNVLITLDKPLRVFKETDFNVTDLVDIYLASSEWKNKFSKEFVARGLPHTDIGTIVVCSRKELEKIIKLVKNTFTNLQKIPGFPWDTGVNYINSVFIDGNKDEITELIFD